MLTPRKLDYITNRLTVQKELEESVLREIVRRIIKTDIVGETTAWQTERLQQSGMLFTEITKRVAAETKKSEEEIRKAFDDAETEIFDAGDVPTKAMERVWQAAFRKTCTEAKNLTKTTAITSQNKYLLACDLAHMQVASGSFTFDMALRNAVKNAASQSMTIIYPKGGIASLDVAIRRSLLTGLNQTAGEINLMRCEELGCDLVEVSAHYGARPSHAVWQGQVYSLSGETKGYDKLSDATGYGTGEGLMGWNCNHSFAPFFEGSKRNYTDEQLKDMKEHTVTYKGEKMTDYEASQLQRSMERDIRKTKRELTALDELQKNRPTDQTKAEFSALSVKLKDQEARLKNFCKQTERRMDTTRTGVFASQSGMGFGKSTSMKAVWANKKSLTAGKNESIIKEKSKSNYLKLDIQLFAEKDMYKQHSASLKKAVRSYEKQIATHNDKIVNPESYVADWNELSIQRQENLKKHWQHEIQNFNNSIDERIAELKRRGDYDE